ncbi:hypothetical protein SAICODRAFT_194919 [Saitoella complicata NRRL Y-17804]|nr:uncharacterized protein SAICODRAFT_194919 [Saitoella complicata NRRL Y-17804]ODQ49657.1 hypothetical protein SAICODRAFT_194919 [Saitoella complicata NRRL Y-17804]
MSNAKLIIAPYPPQDIIMQLPPSTWSAALSTWSTLLAFILSLPSGDFVTVVSDEGSGLLEFVGTYLKFSGGDELDRKVFLVLHRVLTMERVQDRWVDVESVLIPYTRTYGRKSREGVREVLQKLSRNERVAKGLPAFRDGLLEKVGKGDGEAEKLLQGLSVFVGLAPETLARVFLLSAREIVDRCDEVYASASTGLKTEILRVVYQISARALPEDGQSKEAYFEAMFALMDKNDSKLLAELAEKTGLLRKLKPMVGGEDARIDMLVMKLESLRPAHPAPGGKGKGMARDTGQAAELAAEKLTKIAEVRDLLPDLGEGFVEACMGRYEWNSEEVIGRLLEDNIAPDLKDMDRHAKSYLAADTKQPAPPPPSSAPAATYERRNIFDDQEIKREKLHLGKQDRGTADQMLNDKSGIDKAGILARVAAIDMDDDERDDTYDGINDPNVVDDDAFVREDTNADVSGPTGPNIDELLFLEYGTNPSLFERDNATRKSKARAELRGRTGLSDEQIEGWKSMLERDPRRRKALEGRYEFRGNQATLPSTSYRQPKPTSEDEGGATFNGGGRGRGRGRGGNGGGGGRGRGRGGGGGSGRGGAQGGGEGGRPVNVARKEQNQTKRRDQDRQKKMAKGGPPPS